MILNPGFDCSGEAVLDQKARESLPFGTFQNQPMTLFGSCWIRRQIRGFEVATRTAVSPKIASAVKTMNRSIDARRADFKDRKMSLKSRRLGGRKMEGVYIPGSGWVSHFHLKIRCRLDESLPQHSLP